jgi:predicted nucleotidyltransferase
MKSLEQLSREERLVLEELRSRIHQEFPGYSLRMTLFGSRARGEAEPDSDMDVLIELEVPQISFPEKQRLRRIAGEISLESGIILSLLVADQQTRQERGDFSIFQNIREEGIPV